MSDAATQSIVHRVVFLGTYSKHPRQNLLLEALETSPDWEVFQCRVNPWGNVPDKTQIKGVFAKLLIFVKLLLAYPVLFARYLRQPEHDLVVMMHPGLLDVFFLGWLVKFRRKPLVWDIYISWFDTLVNDRRLLKEGRLVARLIYHIERFAAHIADSKFLDTREHADYFETLYSLPKQAVSVVHVGVDSEFLRILREMKGSISSAESDSLRLLYYGNFIPLHGVDTIVKAVWILRDSGINIKLTLVGEGQTSLEVTQLISELRLENVTRISWLPYSDLILKIRSSDICFGIFGVSGKARRVIPNKIYQISAAGIPFISGDTPAISEFCKLADCDLSCELVQPGDPMALAKGIRLVEQLGRPISTQGFSFDVNDVRTEFTNLLIQTLSLT